MAGAEEIFFIEEKNRVLDELIQVSKYSKLKKYISAQPDHDITNIRPSHLEQFYSKNLDLIQWLRPGLPFNIVVTEDILTMIGKLTAVMLCAYGHPIRWLQPRHFKLIE
jgi:hypothetical protein